MFSLLRGLHTYFTVVVSLRLPVRLTPILTSLSLSRTAHLGAANSTLAGCTFPAEDTIKKESKVMDVA